MTDEILLKLRAVLVAEGAMNVGGLWSLQGIIDSLAWPGEPVRLRSVVVFLSMVDVRVAYPLQVGVDVAAPDGSPVFSGNAAISRESQRDSTRVSFATRLRDLVLAAPGTYEFRLYLNGSLVDILTLPVR